MPSKKKGRGKARKAAAKAEKEGGAAANDEMKSGVLDSQMQRLQINSDNQDDDEDTLLEEAIKLAAAEKGELEAVAKNDGANNTVKCWHGFVPLPEGHVCGAFVSSFIDEFNAGYKKSSNLLSGGFNNVYETTITKYAEVWNDLDKLQLVISYFLGNGTKLILEGNNDLARHAAMSASYFEQRVKIGFYKTQPTLDSSKIFELLYGDEHTLVSFFRKRVPCKCLDEKYKEVKSIAKIGICWNPNCSLPGRKADRGKMLHCAKCRLANYCSRECQVADWKSHKEARCKFDASRLAALELKSMQKK